MDGYLPPTASVPGLSMEFPEPQAWSQSEHLKGLELSYTVCLWQWLSQGSNCTEMEVTVSLGKETLTPNSKGMVVAPANCHLSDTRTVCSCLDFHRGAES